MCVWCGLRRDVANRDWVRSLTEVASRRGERGEEVRHYEDPHKYRAYDTTTHEQKRAIKHKSAELSWQRTRQYPQRWKCVRNVCRLRVTGNGFALISRRHTTVSALSSAGHRRHEAPTRRSHS